MTGTALENKVDEMINLIKLLQPSIAMQISGMKELSSAPQFKETVAPVYYRRRREDVLTELPELSEIKEWCQLSDSEERRYEETIFRKNYNAIRRVSWNVPDLKDSGKAKRLLEIIEEAKSEGRKVLVFSFYLDTIRKTRTCWVANAPNQSTDPSHQRGDKKSSTISTSACWAGSGGTNRCRWNGT